MTRRPQARGFYPGDSELLEEKLAELFRDVEGDGEYRAGMVPHAGYPYSGMASASFYSSLEPADSLVVLGNDHFGNAMDISLHPYDYWETPLGRVPVDPGLEEMLDHLGLARVESYREHCIEVQLPFLQHLWGDFSFLPITVPRSPASRLRELGEALADLQVPVVATSDLSHYVPHATAQEKDGRVIEAITAGDPDGLARVVREESISMCGLHPVVALMHAFPGAEAELVAYYTSGDVTGDLSRVVGYASIGFR